MSPKVSTRRSRTRVPIRSRLGTVNSRVLTIPRTVDSVTPPVTLRTTRQPMAPIFQTLPLLM